MILGALGHLPVGATLTNTTTILLTDNEHRVYADERRTQVDMRFAKIVRFGRTRTDVGVDINNLFNTSYATGFNQTYTRARLPSRRGQQRTRDAGWGTPTRPRLPAVRASELHAELLERRVRLQPDLTQSKGPGAIPALSSCPSKHFRLAVDI